MPNYQESKTEKLMIKLTNELSMDQNALFSELLEAHSAMGISRDDLIKSYSEYGILTTNEIRQTFRVLDKVLISHEEESRGNFEE